MTTDLSPAAAHPTDAHCRLGAPEGLSVLVVDDDEDTAQSDAELLTLSGHTVRTAGCGRDALRLAADETPDVVLLDIRLPDLSGREVARRLRLQADGHQLLLVAVTGYGEPDDELRSAAAGIDMHLIKPADPVLIIALLWHVREALAVC